MATYQLECDALTFETIRNTLYCVQKIDREMGRDFEELAKNGGSF